MSAGAATRSRRLMAFAVVASLLPAGAAIGRQVSDTPDIVSPRPELRWLGLEDIELALVLEWRLDGDRRDEEDGTRVRDRQNRFREILEGSTSGYIGHPNLLALDLSGSVWFTQRLLDFDSSMFTGTLNDTMFNWDVRGTFLEQTKVPLTLYSRQDTTDIDRQFGGTLDSLIRQTGIIFNWRDEKFPTNLTVFRRQLEQFDALQNQDFIADQYSFRADGLGIFTPNQRLVWDFTYDDVDEEGDLQVARSFERIKANATYTYNFGERQASQFLSRVHFEDRTGDINFQNLSSDNILRLRHSRELTSWYDYRFRRLVRPESRQVANVVTANFRHELFDSLITSGRGGLNFLDVPTDDFNSWEIFGEVRADYTKDVPGGVFLATADVGLSRLQQSDRGSPITILDAPFQFSAADLIVINDENIVASSIVVTDVTGLITYREGPDYTTLVLQTRAEIRRVPGGNIVFMQTVLVDYAIGPEPGGTTNTATIGGEVRYNFEETFLRGLGLYVRFQQQWQRRTEELIAEGLFEDDFTDFTYGLEYIRRRIFIRAERRHRRSTVSPFDSTFVEARYTDRWTRTSNITLQTIYQQIDRLDVDIRTRSISLSGVWNQQITERLWGDLLLTWQHIDDTVSGNTQAFEQELNLRWRYRQTEMYGKVRNTFRNTSSDDIAAQTYIVGLRREF